MQTFQITLSPTEYTEILQGTSFIAFDLKSDGPAHLILTETATQPSASDPATTLRAWPETWAFEGDGFVVNVQRVWVMGSGDIVGVRG